MTNEQVGRAAGAVWAHLKERGEKGSTLYELKKKIDAFTADEIVAAIGWLAREDKIVWRQEKRRTIVALCESELAPSRERELVEMLG